MLSGGESGFGFVFSLCCFKPTFLSDLMYYILNAAQETGHK